MGTMRPSLFRGPQSNATTIAVPIPIVAGCIGFQVFWPDATTAGTFVLELTSFSSDDAPLSAGGAGTVLPGQGTAVLAGTEAHWEDSGESIAAVTAGAAGSFVVNLSGVRQGRARLLITATDNSNWDIRPGLTDV